MKGDFDIFSHFWSSLTPEGPKNLKIGKKMSTASTACDNFCQKPVINNKVFCVFHWLSLVFVLLGQGRRRPPPMGRRVQRNGGGGCVEGV